MKDAILLEEGYIPVNLILGVGHGGRWWDMGDDGEKLTKISPKNGDGHDKMHIYEIESMI